MTIAPMLCCCGQVTTPSESISHQLVSACPESVWCRCAARTCKAILAAQRALQTIPVAGVLHMMLTVSHCICFVHLDAVMVYIHPCLAVSASLVSGIAWLWGTDACDSLCIKLKLYLYNPMAASDFTPDAVYT